MDRNARYHSGSLELRAALFALAFFTVPSIARAQEQVAQDTTPVASAANAVDKELDSALADVAKARAALKTLQGPFVQERSIALLASKVKSKGRMTLVRPD